MIKHIMKIVVIVLANLWLRCETIQLGRCELVLRLRKLNFAEDTLRDWVCLVEHTSNRYTRLVTVNMDGSHNYGIFQINDKYWCSKTDKPDKDCYVTCAQLMTDDITEAAKCAMRIYKNQKLKAWYGWWTQCQNHTLPDISHCDRHDAFMPKPFFHP